MKCNNCGKEIGNDMSFCPYCGNKQDLEGSQDVAEKKVKKTVKSKNGNTKKMAVIRNISAQTDSNGEDDNIIKEFAIKVLKYMRRSRSERQIAIYTNKCSQTIQYCKKNNIDSEFEPYIFAEALRKLEEEKKTTIYHIEADELAKCIAENKDEFVMRNEQSEQAPKEKSNSSIGKIFGWGIFIAIFLMMKMCGGCNGCDSEDENVIYESEKWKCDFCDKTFTYYKDKYGEHDKWYYYRNSKICMNCNSFRKSVNDAMKKNNSPYADYSY